MDWTYKLRLRNLQMLLSLAQSGNMSHTAQALHTTQPGLSKWLKDLEDDTGVPLFERHARGLRPTVYGAALIEHARRIEAQLDTARDDIAIMREGGSGLVTIGISGASSIDTVPLAVLKILKTMPKAHIRLVENTAARLMDLLSTGDVDIVVARADVEYQNPEFKSVVLYVDPICLVVRPGHPLMKLSKPTWKDVLDYPWALWAKDTPVRTAFDAALAKAGQHPPSTFVESNSAAITLTLLSNSDMVGITSRRPALSYERMNVLGIVPIRLDGFSTVSMYWHQDSSSRLSVVAAIEGIKQVVDEFSECKESN